MLNLAEGNNQGSGDPIRNFEEKDKEPQSSGGAGGYLGPVVGEGENHWSLRVAEAVVSLESDEGLAVAGGSDNGQFPYLGEVLAGVQQGTLLEGSIILEIQGQKVSGYTQRDVVAWLNHCTRDGNPCVIRTAPPGSVTGDLRQYLNTRFPKGGVDHDLQNTIRDNVYLRTVPVTTRTPRPSELNGLDCTFLSHQEFQALKRSGNLLESGVFQGFLYGTPLPSSISTGFRQRLTADSAPVRRTCSHGPQPPIPLPPPSVRGQVVSPLANGPLTTSTPVDEKTDERIHFTYEISKIDDSVNTQNRKNAQKASTLKTVTFTKSSKSSKSDNTKTMSLHRKVGKKYSQFLNKTKQLLSTNEPQEIGYISPPIRNPIPHNLDFYPDRPDLVESRMDYFLGGSSNRNRNLAGNHYGTPKPPSQPPSIEGRGGPNGPGSNSSHNNNTNSILPGAHPSSEGKRRRNRSNVEAMAGNMTEPPANESQHHGGNPPPPPAGMQQQTSPLGSHNSHSGGVNYRGMGDAYLEGSAGPDQQQHLGGNSVDGGDLGPLPSNWEQAFTDKGDPYFIDNLAGTSSWLDPRLAKVQKQKAEECGEDELPYGWERIDDPQYGTYYIDHVNRLTQYENPVTMAKTQVDPSPTGHQDINGSSAADGSLSNNNTFPRQKKLTPEGAGMSPKRGADLPPHSSNPPSVAPKRNNSNWSSATNTTSDSAGAGCLPSSVFTRNPAELRGDFLRTHLVKSSRGLGFTIVGGDDSKDEFLQIKSVVPNGPAWQDGNLRTGDVLVYVNDTCVLGYTHADVVNIFQNIEPGRSVYLEVCRGYPLPFDPNDPNTEIVTTVAVTSMDSRSAKSMFGESYERSRQNSSESLNTAKSMPDLSNPDRVQQVPRPGSADLLSSENYDPAPDILDFYNPNMSKPEYLTIPIVKGSMGFGFTIADSAYGQKVKKILDRGRCKNLMEGDILVDINSINVKRMNHMEVVQVLKECAQGHEAIVMVERGGANSPSKNRPKKEPLPTPKKAALGPSSEGSAFSTGQYRSKTPTADMYSSQTKEVIPNRPKTPLVDTRNRPKTPNAMGYVAGGSYANDLMTRPLGVNAVDHRVPDPAAAGHFPAVYNPPQIPPHQHPSQDISYDSKVGNMTQQMSRVAIDANNYGYFNNDNRSTGGLEYNNYPNNGPMPPPQSYNYHGNTSFPPDSGYNPTNSESYEYDIKRNSSKTPVQDYIYPSYSSNTQQPHPMGQQQQQPPQSYNYYPNNNNSNNGSIPNNPNIINNNLGVGGSTSNGHNISLDNPTGGYGYMYPKDGFDGPRQDSGYSSQTQIPTGHAPPYSAYYGQNSVDGYNPNLSAPAGSYNHTATNDNSLSRRKESTSFEHELPAPVSMPRFPDGRYSVGPRNSRGVPPPNGSGPLPPPHEFTVTLRRQETGFGFRIVGGTEEGSQVSIGHIVSGGAADQDGTVLTGDEILAVNNESVVGASHHRVVTLMSTAAARGQVTLTLCRRHVPDLHNRSMELNFPYDITVTRREDEGFGFVIISSVTKTGSTIGRIIEGSPAERCGRLHVGDRILAVNGEDIKSLHHGSIVNLIKLSGYSVTLTIGPPRDDSSSSTNSQKADSDAGDDSGEYHNVELQRSARGFGFSIRGGREFHNMPLFVLRIAEGGPADHDTKLKVGDQLIEINGQSTKGMTHADAIELIKQSNSSVSLLVKRGGKIPQHLQEPLNTGNVVSPVGPPPPNSNLRSTATLPPPSPSHSPASYPPPPPPHQYPPHSMQHGHPLPPHVYPHNGSARPPPVLHSSPAQYSLPLTPNGPLGQSSPRVIGSEQYWSRMQQ